MKKIIVLLVLIIIIGGCSNNQQLAKNESGLVYEIYVASFNDSDGDEVGDLNGVAAKLPYLRELGVEYIWLMPINKSSSYHKYDVEDYYEIDPLYGTMDDYKNLINKAKEYDIKIIMDLVLNHSSNKNQWFINAVDDYNNNNCQNENSYCEYYNFNDKYLPHYEKINDSLYYEAQFVDFMPDLNLDSLKVRQHIKDIAKYYLEMGVAGFRLDAALHYYDHNDTRNIEFLKFFNDYCNSINPDTYIVAEVWADNNTVKNYYNSGIDSLFNFDLSDATGKIVNAISKEDADSLNKYLNDYYQDIKNIDQDALNAVYLSNHDQGRSAGYLITLEKRKLASAIYLLLPGMPYIYYGEEIGLKGSGKDENKRTYMPWNNNTKIKNPDDADYDQDKQITQTVEEATNDSNSLLNYMRKIINIRNEYSFIKNSNLKSKDLNNALCSYYVYDSDNELLIVHNLSSKTIVESLSEEYTIVASMNDKNKVKDHSLSIEPYSSVVMEKKK